MTTPPAQDAAKVRVFPPLLPLITVLAGWGLEQLRPLGPGPLPGPPASYLLGGVVIIGAVAGLGIWAIRTMRRTGQSENPYRPTTEIVERGPYRFTRNPMYLQMLLACIGIALMVQNIWMILLTPLCALALMTLVIRPEEAYLEAKFGAAYLAYKKRVRRWL